MIFLSFPLITVVAHQSRAS